MTLRFEDFEASELVRMTSLVFRQIRDDDAQSLCHLIDRVRERVEVDTEILNRIVHFDPLFDGSWIYADQCELDSAYDAEPVFFCILRTLTDRVTLFNSLLSAVTTPSLSVPHEVLCLYAEMLETMWDSMTEETTRKANQSIQRLLAKMSGISVMQMKDYALLPGDAIDHLYPAPKSAAHLKLWLDLFSKAYRIRSAQVVLRRLMARLTSQHSAETIDSGDDPVAKIIRTHFCSSFQQSADYLIDWREWIEDTRGSRLMLSELAKTLCMDNFSQLADTDMRRAVIQFYRSVFKLSRNAIMGLTSGLFHAEHGLKVDPSYFFCGPNTIFGKGVRVDLVGGLIVGSSTFIGGGFLPVLIHTHQHLSGSAGSASRERLSIRRHCLCIENGTRIKMGGKMMIEAAEYENARDGIFSIRLKD